MSDENDPASEGNGAEPEASNPDPVDPPPAAPPDPLEEAKAEAAKFREQLLRTAADFDNFRKRTRRELADAEFHGREDILRELLPVFDNLDRAMLHADAATDVQALADGLRMVSKQFLDTLGKLGIERVGAVGLAFDPAVHEAIQHLESSEHPAGVVVAEVQSGYRQGERLLRPALVAVSKGPAKVSENPAPPEEPG